MNDARRVELLSHTIANMQAYIEEIVSKLKASETQIAEHSKAIESVNEENRELVAENIRLRGAIKSARLAIPRQCDRKAFDRHLEIAMGAK